MAVRGIHHSAPQAVDCATPGFRHKARSEWQKDRSEWSLIGWLETSPERWLTTAVCQKMFKGNTKRKALENIHWLISGKFFAANVPRIPTRFQLHKKRLAEKMPSCNQLLSELLGIVRGRKARHGEVKGHRRHRGFTLNAAVAIWWCLFNT